MTPTPDTTGMQLDPACPKCDLLDCICGKPETGYPGQRALEAVRQKCVEANPDKSWITVEIYDDGKEVEISVQPGLADVLLAVLHANPANRTRVTVESSGQFSNALTKMLGPYWNLRDDSLDNQSPECLAYLHSLLCP